MVFKFIIGCFASGLGVFTQFKMKVYNKLFCTVE